MVDLNIIVTETQREGIYEKDYFFTYGHSACNIIVPGRMSETRVTNEKYKIN